MIPFIGTNDISVGLPVGMGFVPLGWDTGLGIRPMSIVSKFTSYSRNFLKLKTIVICSEKAIIKCRRSAPWRSDAKPPKKGLGLFQVTTKMAVPIFIGPTNWTLRGDLATALLRPNITHAHDMTYRRTSYYECRGNFMEWDSHKFPWYGTKVSHGQSCILPLYTGKVRLVV